MSLNPGALFDKKPPVIFIGFQGILAVVANGEIYLFPKGGEEYHVLEAFRTTKLSEHDQISMRNSTHPVIGNTMQVQNTTQADVLLVSCRQPGGDFTQDVAVLSMCIIETRSINKVDVGVWSEVFASKNLNFLGTYV